MMIGMVELETLLCIAGDCNTDIGETEPEEEENVGRNTVDLMTRNYLAVVGSFFQKSDNHQITYMNGHHKTELDLNNIIDRKTVQWWMCTYGVAT